MPALKKLSVELFEMAQNKVWWQVLKGKDFSVLSYAPCHEGMFRSGGIVPYSHKLVKVDGHLHATVTHYPKKLSLVPTEQEAS
jgi:hypothetical protein